MEFLESYFNQQDWGFPHLIRAAQLWPTRAALFWPTRTVPFGPIKLWWFGVLICIKTDQSGTRGRYFSSHKPTPFSSPLALRVRFPFSRKTELKHQRCLEDVSPEQTSAAQSRPSKSRVELSSWSGAWPQGCLTALLFSQPCCVKIELFCTLNKVLSSPHPKRDFLLVLNWHQRSHQLTTGIAPSARIPEWRRVRLSCGSPVDYNYSKILSSTGCLYHSINNKTWGIMMSNK